MTSKIEEGVLSFEAFKQVYVSQVGSGTNFGDIKLLRPGDIDALAAALKRARVASGMCRIAFDHRVQKLGINLVDFGVWGTLGRPLRLVRGMAYTQRANSFLTAIAAICLTYINIFYKRNYQTVCQ